MSVVTSIILSFHEKYLGPITPAIRIFRVRKNEGELHIEPNNKGLTRTSKQVKCMNQAKLGPHTNFKQQCKTTHIANQNKTDTLC